MLLLYIIVSGYFDLDGELSRFTRQTAKCTEPVRPDRGYEIIFIPFFIPRAPERIKQTSTYLFLYVQKCEIKHPIISMKRWVRTSMCVPHMFSDEDVSLRSPPGLHRQELRSLSPCIRGRGGALAGLVSSLFLTLFAFLFFSLPFGRAFVFFTE